MDVSHISRREFLKGSAWAIGLFGMPDWAGQLDETPNASYMSFNAATHPIDWTAPADLANIDPSVLVLNRIAFGPRPGDLERVRGIGVDNFIDEQLSPESIQDSAMDELLTRFPTLNMSVAQLFKVYAAKKAAKKTLQQSGQVVTDVAGAVRGFLGLLGVDSDENAQAPMSPGTPADVVLQVIQATIMRQMFSERQLYELMVDFWSNHFNIYILKNQCKFLKTIDDREVIRPHALGKFSELLHASAKSPAMLVYLDNVANVRGVPQENYSRELMELHTLGVHGGFDQTDVQEVARCFTGWSVSRPERSLLGMDYDEAGEFLFRADKHDDGEKQVLGIKISAGGVQDGEQVLDLLAHHPSTAAFVSRKLVQRFVSDNPPEALVARAAETFQRTDGDIRAVLGTILHSDEFKQSFGQKLKRPLEYVASAVRALGIRSVDVSAAAGSIKIKPKSAGSYRSDAQPIANALREMGQIPFNWQAPNGYPDVGSAWINSNNLLARWNLALALGTNRVPGLQIDVDAAMQGVQIDTAGAAVDFWIERLLHHSIPDADRQKLIDVYNADTPRERSGHLVALILASPHFHYR